MVLCKGKPKNALPARNTFSYFNTNRKIKEENFRTKLNFFLSALKIEEFLRLLEQSENWIIYFSNFIRL